VWDRKKFRGDVKQKYLKHLKVKTRFQKESTWWWGSKAFLRGKKGKRKTNDGPNTTGKDGGKSHKERKKRGVRDRKWRGMQRKSFFAAAETRKGGEPKKRTCRKQSRGQEQLTARKHKKKRAAAKNMNWGE